MENKIIYALGVGHNTPVFIDLAMSTGYQIGGLYHYNSDRTGECDHGFKILGSFDELFALPSLEGKAFLLTMGDTKIKEQLTKQILDKGGEVPTIIHPTAVISKFATISPIGVYISAFTHVQADTEINEGTILLSGVNISHTNVIGKYCFVAGGGTIGAYTHVGNHVFVGQGALTISGKVNTIGDNAFIGAGSLVTKPVDENIKIVGRLY